MVFSLVDELGMVIGQPSKNHRLQPPNLRDQFSHISFRRDVDAVVVDGVALRPAGVEVVGEFVSLGADNQP